MGGHSPQGVVMQKSAVAVARERWKCIASVCTPLAYCSLPPAACVMKKQFFCRFYEGKFKNLFLESLTNNLKGIQLINMFSKIIFIHQ